MPDYVIKRRAFTAEGRFEAGQVATLSEELGERLVANGWAERKAGRPRKADGATTGKDSSEG